MRTTGFLAVAAITALPALAHVSPAIADDFSTQSDRAVSTINYKLEIDGAFGDDVNGALARGAVAIPLSDQFGMQLDGHAGSVGGDFFGNVGGHFFWRDPSIGLAGVFASATYFDAFGGQELFRVGLKGEYFFHRVTVRAMTGWEEGDIPGDGYFIFADLLGYAADDVMLRGGARYTADQWVAATGFEALVDRDNGLSIVGEGRLGIDDDEAVGFLGVRWYFGAEPGKNLIRRHREDDPELWGIEDQFLASGPQGLAGCPAASPFPINTALGREIRIPEPTAPSGCEQPRLIKMQD